MTLLTRRHLTPIPLEARASSGRATAAVMAVLVLAGGVLASTESGDDVPLPTWLLVVVISTGTAVYLYVALGPWTSRLSERGRTCC